MRGACVAGEGTRSEDLRRSSKLDVVFKHWPDKAFPLHAARPDRQRRTAKVGAFTAFCSALLTGREELCQTAALPTDAPPST